MRRAKCAIFKRTDSLAGVLADFLEVLGGGVLVLAAVLGDVAGDLGGVVGADRLDIGRVRALAVECQFALCRIMYVKRILLDGSEKACRRSCDCDARGDGQNGEDGGLCEHVVDFLVVFVWFVWFVCGRRRVSRESENVVF